MKQGKTASKGKAVAKTAAKSVANVSAKKHKILGIIWIILGVLLLAYLAYGVALYLNTRSDDVTRTVTGIFWYPAAKVFVPDFIWRFLLSVVMLLIFFLSLAKLLYLAVTKKLVRSNKVIVTGFLFLASIAAMFSLPRPSSAVVGYHEYLDYYRALQQFQGKRQQLSPQDAQLVADDDLKARTLQQLILADVIRQEADKYDVNISRKEVNDTYKQYADRSQGEDQLKKQLKDFLGWGPEQFKKEIRTQLLQQKLNTKLATDDSANKERLDRINVYVKDVKGGKDFAEVAKSSDDATAQAGGDQGFVKRGELDPAVEQVAFKLQPGEVSDVIKTQQGFVVIKVEEKKGDQEVKFRQILVRTKSLAEFIPDELKGSRVSIFVKGFVWDKQLYAVQPKNKPAAPQGSPTPAASPGAPAAPAQQP